MRARSATLLVLGVVLGLLAPVVAGCAGAGRSTTKAAVHPASSRTQVRLAARTTAQGTGAGRTERPAKRGAPAVEAGNSSSKPLAGQRVGIDPGHNGRNGSNPAFINHLIFNGRQQEGCDTTGTETDAGYTESRFNFNLATYLAADLRAEGAKVTMTRTSNNGVGPCVTTRAQIINRSHPGVAIDIHADGGPAGGRGVAILEPVADGPNNRVIAASKRFGAELLKRYRALARVPDSTYDGNRGVAFRNDLAGLNLTTVPKVLIECGNMRNGTDAALLSSPSFQRLAARSFAQAIATFLTHRHR